MSISDAENLRRHLQAERERGKLSYVMLKHEIENSALHTIRKNDYIGMDSWGKNGKATNATDGSVEFNMKAETFSQDGASFTRSVSLSPADGTLVTSMHAPIYHELQVGQEIMLGVAWCRDEERRLFELYPEVLLFGVTYAHFIL